MTKASTARRGPMICPVCFATFPGTRFDPRFPDCPHCDSEAIQSALVPVADLLARHPTAEIEGWVASWKAETGFVPEYHAQKLERMENLLARSQRMRG